MSNIHGLHSRRDSSSDDDDGDENNNRYVGGVDSRGGGSGLAVQPNTDDSAGGSGGDILDSIRGSAAQADGSEGPVRRTITMYRDGFTVDDGPYRPVNDPANSEFLSALARGRTPRELVEEAGEGGDVTVGLVDKRGEDYSAPERPFQSFSGEGTSLGSSGAAPAEGGVITPTSDAAAPELDAGRPSTSIQVRLLNGRRLVVKVNEDSPVSVVGDHINASGDAGSDPYVLSAGFPPRPIKDLGQTVKDAGLKGAQVMQKKA